MLTRPAGYFDDNIEGGSGLNTVGGDVDPEQARPVMAQKDEPAAVWVKDIEESWKLCDLWKQKYELQDLELFKIQKEKLSLG